MGCFTGIIGLFTTLCSERPSQDTLNIWLELTKTDSDKSMMAKRDSRVFATNAKIETESFFPPIDMI